MPIKSCTLDGKPGFKYGDSGHCYTYTEGDESSKERAKEKADKQRKAIEYEKHRDCSEECKDDMKIDISNMKFIKNYSDEDGVYEMYLYNAIGDDGMGNGISGESFAMEMDMLQSVAKEIRLRINSPGGSVIDGYSIISSIQRSIVPVTGYIDGVACSIAGIIALVCPKLYMNDYGTLMIHNPSGAADHILEHIKDTLVTILRNCTQMGKKEMEKMMDEETWLNAKECMDMGLIDDIIKTGKKSKIKANIKDGTKLFEIYNQALLNADNKKTKPNMELIANKLNMDVNKITEEMVITSIENRDTEISDLKKKLEDLEKEKTELQNKIDEIAKKEQEEQDKKINEMISNYVTLGKIDKENIEEMTNLAKVNFNAVKNMLEKVGNATAPEILNIQDKVKQSYDHPLLKGRESWKYKDWLNKDEKGLSKLETEFPEIADSLKREFKSL